MLQVFLRSGFLLFLVLISFASISSGAMLISEIMYHPREYEDYFEYIEIHNSDSSQTVDLTGYSVPQINWVFSSGSIAPGGYVVIARNRVQLLRYSFGFCFVPNFRQGVHQSRSRPRLWRLHHPA